MPTCGNCRQEVEFYEHGGLFYCTECETQSQVMRVFEKDDDFDTKLDYAHAYSASKPKRKRRINRVEEDVAGEERTWWSCELYQSILKAQVKALVAMGFSAKLDEVVMQLWFRFISKSKLAFCKAAKSCSAAKGLDSDEDKEENEKTLNKSSLSSPDGPSARKKGKKGRKVNATDDWLHQTEKGESAGRSARTTTTKRTRLVLWDSVCFMYLGLRWLQEPVLLSDLLRLVREGRLPLRSTAQVTSDHIAKNMSAKDIVRFCNPQMSIPDISLIVDLVSELSKKLDFTSFHLIQLDLSFTIARMVHALNLPAELCCHAHQLHLRVKSSLESPIKGPHSKAAKRKIEWNPRAVECQALAYIIVALKLLFTLDDQSEQTLSLRTQSLQSLFPKGVRLFNWDAWVAAQKLRFQHHLGQEGSINSVSDIKKVRSMDKFVRHFKGFYQVEQVHKHFHNRHHRPSGRQDILKEFQRPFRALHENSSTLQGQTRSTFLLTGTVSQTVQLDSDEVGDDNSDTTQNDEDHDKPTTSSKWLSRRYLLHEDFSKHTLKHLTNLQELCEQYIIPPECMKKVLDLVVKGNSKMKSKCSPENESESSTSEETSFVKEGSTGSNSGPDESKDNDKEEHSRVKYKKSGENKEIKHDKLPVLLEDTTDDDLDEKPAEQLKGKYFDDWNRLYVTYPSLAKRPSELSLEHHMDCFHLSMEWLLGRCSQLCETRPNRLYYHVNDIEKVLFKL